MNFVKIKLGDLIEKLSTDENVNCDHIFFRCMSYLDMRSSGKTLESMIVYCRKCQITGNSSSLSNNELNEIKMKILSEDKDE
jgi:hypothetical protein